MTCLIYEKRPDICRAFPTNEHEIKEFSSCGYSFKDGIRTGECNGCEACCSRMPFGDSLDLEAVALLDKAPLAFVPATEDGVFVKTDLICRFKV